MELDITWAVPPINDQKTLSKPPAKYAETDLLVSECNTGHYDFTSERKRKKQGPSGLLTVLVPEADMAFATDGGRIPAVVKISAMISKAFPNKDLKFCF